MLLRTELLWYYSVNGEIGRGLHETMGVHIHPYKAASESVTVILQQFLVKLIKASIAEILKMCLHWFWQARTTESLRLSNSGTGEEEARPHSHETTGPCMQALKLLLSSVYPTQA